MSSKELTPKQREEVLVGISDMLVGAYVRIIPESEKKNARYLQLTGRMVASFLTFYLEEALKGQPQDTESISTDPPGN